MKKNEQIIKKPQEDILYRKKLEEEMLLHKQKMQEIRERIREFVHTNNTAFIKTLKMFLSSE